MYQMRASLKFHPCCNGLAIEELKGGSESAVAIEAAIISQLLGCEGS
jgi:hypothetical protein